MIFLYGTLLRPDVLDRESGRAGLWRGLRPAMLHGYARVFLRGTPFPTLMRRKGAAVGGALLRADGETLARLNEYEGPPYRLVPVTVETERGPVRARAWMAPAWRADRRVWVGMP
ncbi:gamma-glutamylcyclotransferase family protein [Rhodovarius crocodyli]|uniref:gamma-glutamylcyclotransferase family protein n=1 Tax=Rhodovarius crocodyli TaxID=1979269 RepID=UPI0013E2F753|nr:gamma-glutamylcyclotransferase family protein [Rhodovarius crocodyli]